MIKYRTMSDKIERVEVLRETKTFVIIQESGTWQGTRRMRGRQRREKKSSGYTSYFDTWELAYQHVMAEVNGEIAKIKRRLEYYINQKERLASIIKPEDGFPY